MFPKTVTTTVAMPPEKPCVNGAKDSAVLYIGGGEQQVVADNYSRWRVKRAAICACTVVLTTLILVAGALGAITIVLKHTNVAVHKVEPTRSSLFGKTTEPKMADPKPRIKIDDNGLLWPTEPLATELVAIEGGIDEGIKIDDGEDTPERVPSGNEVQIDEEGDVLTEQPPERPTVSKLSSAWSSSSSQDESSSSEAHYRYRTYLSSSFPYDGYYMRGGEGNPPWHKESYDGKLPSSWEEDSGVEDLSGDEDEDVASGAEELSSSRDDSGVYDMCADEEAHVSSEEQPYLESSFSASGASSDMDSEDGSSVSYSDPYIVSE